MKPSRSVEITTVLLAFAALVIGILNWLHPFGPARNSPFAVEPTFAVPTPIVVTVIASPTPAAKPPGTTAKPSTSAGRIIFDSPVEGKWQVFAIYPDGSNLVQLTSIPSGIGDPAISPDGKKIVFAADNGKKLQVMKADGTQVTTVYNADVEVGWPNWSSDSRQIVFAVRKDDRANLFTMNSDGTGLTQITDSRAHDLTPAFSPDNSQVVFSSDRTGQWEIYKLTLGTNELVKLTNLRDPQGQGWPSWSPDGLFIAIESQGQANSRDIFVMNADGTQIRNVTNSPAYEGAPVWSSDGNYIAFASDRNKSLDIYIMQNDDGEIRRLTSIWAWGPSWSSQ